MHEDRPTETDTRNLLYVLETEVFGTTLESASHIDISDIHHTSGKYASVLRDVIVKHREKGEKVYPTATETADENIQLRTLEAEADTWALLSHLCTPKLAKLSTVCDRIRTVIVWLEDIEHARQASEVKEYADLEAYFKVNELIAEDVLDCCGCELGANVTNARMRKSQAQTEKTRARLYAAIWRLLRAGQRAKARSLCNHVGQPWLAVTFSDSANWSYDFRNSPAQKDYTNSVDEAQRGPTRLNFARHLMWKRVCAAAAQAAHSSHEAAVYGLLAGELTRVLPECREWTTELWAASSCWLEDFLKSSECLDDAREHCQQTAVSRDILSPLCQLFTKLSEPETSKGNQIFLDKHREVQKLILLERWDDLANVIKLWVSHCRNHNKAQYSHVLRFTTHLTLLLQYFPKNQVFLVRDCKICHWDINDLVQEYVVHLVTASYYTLIPRYAQYLRPARIERTYLELSDILLDAPAASKAQLLKAASAYLPVEGPGSICSIVRLILSSARDPEHWKTHKENNLHQPLRRMKTLEYAFSVDGTQSHGLFHTTLLCRELATGSCYEDVLRDIESLVPYNCQGRQMALFELQAWKNYFFCLKRVHCVQLFLKYHMRLHTATKLKDYILPVQHILFSMLNSWQMKPCSAHLYTSVGPVTLAIYLPQHIEVKKLLNYCSYLVSCTKGTIAIKTSVISEVCPEIFMLEMHPVETNNFKHFMTLVSIIFADGFPNLIHGKLRILVQDAEDMVGRAMSRRISFADGLLSYSKIESNISSEHTVQKVAMHPRVALHENLTQRTFKALLLTARETALKHI
mmetsp:Transcript_9154/g.31808  ORF Transcript_9154/g.31808 Transcript_9154/m.31808 type:complete len:805 (-) Transcript_9154:780-3194(-)